MMIDRAIRSVRIGPVVVPLSVSLLVHVVAAAALFAVAWTIGTSRGSSQTGREVTISLEDPSPAVATNPPADAGAPEAPVVSPAPVSGVEPSAADLPRLEGLSSAAAPPPALRSSVADPLGALPRQAAPGGATFAGAKADRAARIVYVVDASGAMVSSLKFVLAELERSIMRLGPDQEFQVVLFHRRSADRPAYELFDPDGRGERARLVPATALNKGAAAAWLRTIQPAGRSDPEAGLVRGLALEPDVIFLLSRSIPRSRGDLQGVWGRGTAEILARLDRLNPRGPGGRRPTVIKTIQFIEEDPTGTMQAIGREHGEPGGPSYRVLTLEELGAE